MFSIGLRRFALGTFSGFCPTVRRHEVLKCFMMHFFTNTQFFEQLRIPGVAQGSNLVVVQLDLA